MAGHVTDVRQNGVADEWMLFEGNALRVPGPRSLPSLDAWDDLDEREAALRIHADGPILLRPDGFPDHDVLRYLNSFSYRRLAPTTQIAYAYDLRVHLSFLWSQGIDWRDATEEHMRLFEAWRYRDESAKRVTGGKFARELAADRRFYEWQVGKNVIARSPVELTWRQGWGGKPVAVPELLPPDPQVSDVKWLTPAAYRFWRDVGLRGYGADGTPDKSWAGRNGARNAAFAETLWSSGLRTREAATLLLHELPANAHNEIFPRGRVATAVAKGRGRPFRILDQALQAVDGYRISARDAAVRRAQAAGRYESLPDILIVSSITANRQVRYRDNNGASWAISLDALGAQTRRNLFVEGASGLEPAMLWLNEAGMPMAHTHWKMAFHAANLRCRAQEFPQLRCYPHMLRHSFALHWLIIFQCAFRHEFDHLAPERLTEFSRLFGDPYAMVQHLLGHRNIETTRQTYLEPAQDLTIDVLLRGLDDKELAANVVLALIAERSDRVLDMPQ